MFAISITVNDYTDNPVATVFYATSNEKEKAVLEEMNTSLQIAQFVQGKLNGIGEIDEKFSLEEVHTIEPAKEWVSPQGESIPLRKTTHVFFAVKPLFTTTTMQELRNILPFSGGPNGEAMENRWEDSSRHSGKYRTSLSASPG